MSSSCVSLRCVILLAVLCLLPCSQGETSETSPYSKLGLARNLVGLRLRQARLYSKRPERFVGMRGKKSSDASSEEDELAEDTSFQHPAKRKPAVFMGMRGKKEQDELLTAYEHEMLRNQINEAFLANQAQKSSKENHSDISNSLNDERTFENHEDESEIENEKRKQKGAFMGMRGKRESTPYESDEDLIAMVKRSSRPNPVMRYDIMRLFADKNHPLNFVYGMTKSKSWPSLESDGFRKRGSDGRFIAMRGKKYFDEVSGIQNDESASFEEEPTRKLIFPGRQSVSWRMRTPPFFYTDNRDYGWEDYTENPNALGAATGFTDYSKRSKIPGFMGMRGKKHAGPKKEGKIGGFVGSRGKKNVAMPWEAAQQNTVEII